MVDLAAICGVHVFDSSKVRRVCNYSKTEPVKWMNLADPIDLNETNVMFYNCKLSYAQTLIWLWANRTRAPCHGLVETHSCLFHRPLPPPCYARLGSHVCVVTEDGGRHVLE